MKLWNATTEDYKALLLALLPGGAFWRKGDDEPTVQLLQAVAQHFAHVHGLIYTIAASEASPGTATALLAGWERDLGLPDPCLGQPATAAERRQVALAKYTATGGQTATYYVELAANLGLEITVTENPYTPFYLGRGQFGDPLYSGQWAYVWRVTTTGPGPIERLECLINRLKPAHTIVEFVYT